MATATVTKSVFVEGIAKKVTLTLTEDEAIGLKTLLNFSQIPSQIEGAENIARVGKMIDTVYCVLDAAGIKCSYNVEKS